LIVDGKIDISDEAQSAQIIDGQHRIAGLKEAIKSKSEIKELEIPSPYTTAWIPGPVPIFSSQ